MLTGLDRGYSKVVSVPQCVVIVDEVRSRLEEATYVLNTIYMLFLRSGCPNHGHFEHGSRE
jgi:hypothetical protein